MFSWFQKLLPTQGDFFTQFEAHSKTLTGGANALTQLLSGNGDMTANIKSIEDYEHAADDITRAVLQSVRRTFLTPFDRSAITSLIGKMDDAIDEMQKTASAAELFEVASFEPEMQEMGAIILEAAQVTEQAVPMLRNLSGNATALHALTERLVKLEGKADGVQAAGMKRLFKQHGATNPTQFIVGRALYVHLEKVVDRFEDVANDIDGLVIDHA
jgi:uncharacterized protein